LRVLITGISGFVGRYIADQLQVEGAEVCGICRNSQNVRNKFRAFVGDLADQEFLNNLVKEIKPTHVFHAAGVLGGVRNTVQYKVNVIGTVNLLDALLLLETKPLVFILSSSAVYGFAPDMPIYEDTNYNPISHYGVSKVAQELVSHQYQLDYDMQIVRIRTFNLIGPRQSRSMVSSELAYQVACAEMGGPRVLRVGNLAPRRDYTDVRDAVEAYVLLAKLAKPGNVFNVCSGQSYAVQDVVDLLMEMSTVPLKIKVEPQRKRSVEISDQIGSFKRLNEDTQWQPKISFKRSVADLLDDWRNHLQKIK